MQHEVLGHQRQKTVGFRECAIVDEGNIVVFRPQEPHIENTRTGWRIPMNRRQGVFVVQLDARAGTRSSKTVKLDEPNTNSVFRWSA